MASECTARIIRGDARCMAEVDDQSVHLVVTSPPYWQIKDYGSSEQIGFGQSLHDYLFDLSRVWHECWRVLQPGRRLCINIGDQFARASVYGRYQVIPLHSEIIAQCAAAGFDYLGAIIWRKRTTMQTTGGATIMGSFPHPPNGIVELDYEYILLFKKPGSTPQPPAETKAASRLTTEEWKEFFNGHWEFPGTRQNKHEAMFPTELPRRLIRMFSFAGETVLDPFLGSGTTAQVALELGRAAVGYEIQPEYVELAVERLEGYSVQRQDAPPALPVAAPSGYHPHVPDACVPAEPTVSEKEPAEMNRVVDITGASSLQLDDGNRVSLRGIRVAARQAAAARAYLQKYVLGKMVRVQWDDADVPGDAYVYLSNGLFINRKMIEMGLAVNNTRCKHRLSDKFKQAQEKYRNSLQ